MTQKDENAEEEPVSVSATSLNAQRELFKRFFKEQFNFKKRSRHFVDIQIHGIADIFHADTRCLRIFWSLVVLVAIACAVVMCSFIIRSAAEKPTVTEVLYVTPRDVQYPVVTICDSSEVGSYFLNGSLLRRDSWTTSAIYYMLTSAPLWILDAKEVPTNDSFTHVSVKTQLNLLKSRHPSLNNSQEDAALLFDYFYQDYGIDCEQLFGSCRDSNWHSFNCCAAFRPAFNFQHGLCYASDPSKMPKISASGMFSNLFIKLRKMTDLWLNPFRRPVKWSVDVALDNGIDQGIWRADKITLMEGHWATAKLDIMSLFSKEFELTSKCALPMVALTTKGFAKLSETSFNASETSLSSFKSCPELSSIDHLERYCTADEILDYVFKFSKARQAIDDSEIAGISYWMNELNLSTRADPCLEPCSRWDYSYTVEEKPESNLGDQFSGVTLTLTHPQYPQVREKSTMNFQDYLALIGGTCGLWLGASLVTLIQFVVYTFRFLFRTRLTHRESVRLSTIGDAQLAKPPSRA